MVPLCNVATLEGWEICPLKRGAARGEGKLNAFIKDLH